MGEVTLEQYQRFYSIQQNETDEMQIAKAAVQIFCNVEDARDIEFESVKRISKHITGMLNQKPPLTTFWGKFGFHSNLSEITLGELIDLDNYLSKVETMHRAMAVLYRPVISRFANMYQIEEYEGADKFADEMRKMPLNVAIGCSLFFYRLGNELTTSILPFLEMPTIEEMTYQRTAHLQSVGDGTQVFTNLREVTS